MCILGSVNAAIIFYTTRQMESTWKEYTFSAGWYCVSTWHKMESSERKKLRKGLHEIQLQEFSQLVINNGEPSPLWMVPS